MSRLLEISGLEVAYGRSQALFGVDLAMEEGEAATLLGRNGMGKTTLLRAICGLQPLRSGSIRFAGERIDGWRADRIGRAGIALVPEGRQVFPNLTVAEHLLAFFANRRGVRDAWTPARVLELFPPLQERSKNLGNQRSGGEQQMLAVGRALVTNPRLLILDEASEGLAPLVREEIWACLARLRAAGQSILVVDKYVEKRIGTPSSRVGRWSGREARQNSTPIIVSGTVIWGSGRTGASIGGERRLGYGRAGRKRETGSRPVSCFNCIISLVGAPGFELGTPCTPCKCATRLRHAPTSRIL